LLSNNHLKDSHSEFVQIHGFSIPEALLLAVHEVLVLFKLWELAAFIDPRSQIDKLEISAALVSNYLG
jgi:hypothetical protein